MRTLLPAFLLAACLAPAAMAQPPRPGADQREFTSPMPLLDETGSLAAWGWARRAVMQYNRSAIPMARQPRIKEWEHYTIMSPEFTVGATIVQLGTIVVGSAELIDYADQSIRSAMFMTAGKADAAVLPADPYGETRLAKKDDFVSMRFSGTQRQIEWRIGRTQVQPEFIGQIELDSDPAIDSVAITRPFVGEGEFFYENKIFGMPARGEVTLAGKTYTFPAGEAWAIFDWGRGVWPHESQWFWGQAAGKTNGRQVAVNLGHGYGDDSHGTCNCILVDGKLHKLDVVDCQFDANDRMQPWKFTSNDHRLTLDFQPIYNQHSKQDLLGLLSAELHKIHGRFSGTLVLDDGSRLEVRDLLGFAEHMKQKW